MTLPFGAEASASFISARAALEAAAEEFAAAKATVTGEPLRFLDARAKLGQAAMALAEEVAVFR